MREEDMSTAQLFNHIWLEWQLFMAEYWQQKANFNPSQPRVPCGHEDGGQWVAVGTGSHLDDETERDLLEYLRHHIPKPVSGLQSYIGTKPDFIPPDVDIDENMRIATEHWLNAKWFYDQVTAHGPWDYKRRKRVYEDFGNFHYGAVGRAAGFSEETLLRAAGWKQVQDSTTHPSYGTSVSMLNVLLGVGGIPPFGDDPKDQYWIKRGFLYYEHWKRDTNKRK